MNDDTDDKVDYLNSPDMGSVGGSDIEGFKAPVIERPAGGVVEAITKPQPAVVPEDNSAALNSVRTALAAENTKDGLYVNEENRKNIDAMMEANLEAEKRRQQQSVIEKDSPIGMAFNLTKKGVSFLFRRR